MESLSFDGLVELYDETRAFDPSCFDAALTWLVERFPPRKFGRLFEPGIGTGRIAVPLAERGYQVTGVDISEEMLAFLNERLAQSGRPLPITFQKADVTAMPFSESAFDMAIAVHLFYFISDWQKAADEILRVVRSEGPLVLMHTGTGAEIPFLNERYKEWCARLGCPVRGVGVKSTGQVVDYFTSLGCRVEWIRDRWRWISHVRLDKALGYIRSRAYSFTTLASDDVHSLAVERLESELKHQHGSLNVEIEIPNQIYLVVILRGTEHQSSATENR